MPKDRYAGLLPPSAPAREARHGALEEPLTPRRDKNRESTESEILPPSLPRCLGGDLEVPELCIDELQRYGS